MCFAEPVVGLYPRLELAVPPCLSIINILSAFSIITVICSHYRKFRNGRQAERRKSPSPTVVGIVIVFSIIYFILSFNHRCKKWMNSPGKKFK